MIQTRECEEFAGRGCVERFLAHKLASDELDAFEAHFVTCEYCQQAIMLGSAIRRVLPQVGAAPSARRWRVLAGGIGLAAAAGIAALLLVPRQPPPALERLGDLIQAPIYLGVPVRANEPASADSLFGTAMASYVSERYDEAAAGLRAALRAGVDSAPAEFFLGASHLMLRQPEEAAASFARVIALGDTPYLAEAHFYRAKALLRLGQAPAALVELRQAAGLGGVIGGYARMLTDSVERVPQR